MKTLDEVIMCLEGCGHIDCDDCPYHYEDEKIEVDNCAQAYKDALYYLKMYRSDMQMYAENQKHWETELMQKIKDFGDAKERYIAKLKELNIGTLNEPLSWDELRQMEGKPVWVEGSAFAYGFWAIPYCFENSGGNEYVFMWGDQYWREEMRDADDGISWQAYRKERS